MLAQRSSADTHIIGVEIEVSAAGQAVKNVQASAWPEKVDIQCADIQEVARHQKQNYDLIVSNPPFYPPGQNLKTQARAKARHSGSLSHSDLLQVSHQLIKTKGRLAFILPTEQAHALASEAKLQGWHCKRWLDVKSKPSAQVMRVLFELQREAVVQSHDQLIIYDANGAYSQDYVGLTQDFYLKM